MDVGEQIPDVELRTAKGESRLGIGPGPTPSGAELMSVPSSTPRTSPVPHVVTGAPAAFGVTGDAPGGGAGGGGTTPG